MPEPPPPAERATGPVEIRLSDGSVLPGHLALPPGDGPFPGVVVLHEILGLNDDIRDITERFAASGYAALAPDLYRHGNRAVCLTRVVAGGLTGHGERRVLDDVEAARRHLADHPMVDARRIAVAGFCMGGGFALLYAARGGVRAAAVNYGAVPKQREALRDVCPVVASYGALDHRFAAQAERLEHHLDALGVPHDVKVYAGAGHSFVNHHELPALVARVALRMHAGFHEAAAEDTWRRIFGFFDAHVVA